MEQEPPRLPPEEPEEAEIVRFPARNEDAERHQSKWRHPASGRETPQETLRRLKLDNESDDPGSA